MKIKAKDTFNRYKANLNFLSKQEVKDLKDGKAVDVKDVVGEALVNMGWVEKDSPKNSKKKEDK